LFLFFVFCFFVFVFVFVFLLNLSFGIIGNIPFCIGEKKEEKKIALEGF